MSAPGLGNRIGLSNGGGWLPSSRPASASARPRSQPGLAPEGPAPAASQRRALARAPAAHPDAVRRELEREERRQQRLLTIDAERRGRWWEAHQTPPNCVYVNDITELVFGDGRVSSTGGVVMHFFHPECPGCRTMHPKLLQIIAANPSLKFIAVNTACERIQAKLAEEGVTTMPHFRMYLDGELHSQFTCNLTTIDRLRCQIAELTLPAKHGLVADDARGAERRMQTSPR